MSAPVPPIVSQSPPVALITGGGGELAQAIRHELISQGWSVHAPGHREMDVTSKEQVQQVIGHLGRLDLLIHNAGITRDRLLRQMTEADFNEVLAVHLKGAFLCAQAVLPIMTAQGSGHLVQIGSFSAFSGPVGQANYAAAKAGLIALTQSLAVEYGPQGIRANCVLPGFLRTRMTHALLADEEHASKVLAAHALERLNTVQDCARFIAFLHTLPAVSGQVFQLDSRLSRWT